MDKAVLARQFYLVLKSFIGEDRAMHLHKWLHLVAAPLGSLTQGHNSNEGSTQKMLPPALCEASP